MLHCCIEILITSTILLVELVIATNLILKSLHLYNNNQNPTKALIPPTSHLPGKEIEDKQKAIARRKELMEFG